MSAAGKRPPRRGDAPAGSPFPPFPWKTLDGPLRESEREGLVASLGALLRFQRALERWTPLRGAPDATPFVSVYAGGTLRGCYGSQEGGPAERLARAFLRAQGDDRFGGVSPAERVVLAAQVSYPRAARLVNPARAEDEIEPGTHGVALVRDHAPAVLLLPHVARDEGLGAAGLLQALSRKARLDSGDLGDGALYLFETEDVVARQGVARPLPEGTPAAHAAAWLAALVGADGQVTFALDPRAPQERIETGPMRHGRAAVVVQALAAAGGRPAVVARARAWLSRDVRAALGGARVEGWPDAPAAVAGTLALAVLAGVPVEDELAAFAGGPSRDLVAGAPWHAAQVVVALGARAPAALWAACVADLESNPWAPWTLMAAVARRDHAVRDRARRAVAEGLRRAPPHRGGAAATPVPEVALTALSVEALACSGAAGRAAVARGCDFLRSLQLVGPRLHGALDPALAHGAFPASPIADLLRGDVTGHALLALLTARRAPAALDP